MSKDGLKPIGEIVKDALSGMGGPVPAIRETVGYLHTHGRGITLLIRFRGTHGEKHAVAVAGV